MRILKHSVGTLVALEQRFDRIATSKYALTLPPEWGSWFFVMRSRAH